MGIRGVRQGAQTSEELPQIRVDCVPIGVDGAIEEIGQDGGR
jgi:hypothetical protein